MFQIVSGVGHMPLRKSDFRDRWRVNRELAAMAALLSRIDVCRKRMNER